MRRASRGATPELAQMLRAFGRMSRPHAAQDDTVLFPAFRRRVDASFGEHGFESAVAEVARLELALGIGDLSAVPVPSQAPER